MYKSATQKNYKDKFISQCKTITKEESIDNHIKREDLKRKMVHSYNEYIDYIAPYFEKFDAANKADIAQEIQGLRVKLLQCFKVIHVNHQLPSDILDNINLNEVLCEHELIELAKLYEQLTQEAIKKSEEELGAVDGTVPPTSTFPVPLIDPNISETDKQQNPPTAEPQKTTNPPIIESKNTETGTTDQTSGTDQNIKEPHGSNQNTANPPSNDQNTENLSGDVTSESQDNQNPDREQPNNSELAQEIQSIY